MVSDNMQTKGMCVGAYVRVCVCVCVCVCYTVYENGSGT